MTDLPTFRAPLAILLIELSKRLAQTFVAGHGAVVDISAHSIASGRDFRCSDQHLVSDRLSKLIVVFAEHIGEVRARVSHLLLRRSRSVLAAINVSRNGKKQMRGVNRKLCTLLACAGPTRLHQLACSQLACAVQLADCEFDVWIRAVLAWHTAQRSSGVIGDV